MPTPFEELTFQKFNRAMSHTEDLHAEIDHAFDGLLATAPSESLPMQGSAAKISVETDSTDHQQLFCEIAAGYCQPLKNFIFEVSRGMGHREWVEYCRPSLRAILNGVRQMGFPEDSITPIECLDDSLARLELFPATVISQELRTLILAQYDVMERRLPKIFKRGQTDTLREKIIIESLLLQLPSVGTRTMNQLAAAGLASLHALFLASAVEMSAVTGVSLSKTQKICNKLAAHRHWMESIPPDKLEETLLGRLRELTDKLKIWGRKKSGNPLSPSAMARKEFPQVLPTRENKRVTLLEIRLVLAELNQVGVLRRLEGTRTSTAISILENFLS
jgi:hypothetical protein